jgi:hypothetical protein
VTTFDDRFGASFPNRRVPPVPFTQTPPGVPGLSLATPPMAAPPPVMRLDPAATDAWRGRVDRDVGNGVVPNPAAPPPMAQPGPFPTEAAAVPYTQPAVQAGGPSGITMNSTPAAPGWAGTVGLGGQTPQEKAAFTQGNDYAKTVAGLEEISKGLRPKVSDAAAAAAATITPMSSGAQPNIPSSLAHDLMMQVLQGRRKPQGLTLTG